MQSLKNKNHVKEHEKLVSDIKKQYGSLRKASVALKVPWKTFHRLCQKLKKRKKMVRDQWVEIRDNILTELPNIKTAGRRYLTKTLEQSYQFYKEECIYLGKKSMSFATFCRFKPKNVYTINHTPDRQCICDTCENFQLLRKAFRYSNIKGIASHTNECIKQSLCTVCKTEKVDENNGKSNAEHNTCDDQSDRDIPQDGFHQVDPNYGHFSCITRDCKKCGPQLVLMSILENNEGIQESKQEVSWDRWEWVPKKGLKTKRLNIVTKYGTKNELIEQYLADLKEMSYHLFSCHWNYNQFIHCKENLKPGQLLQVLDFGQNYMNVYQDEPQGVHWDHSQTVLHPIVNYYLDKEGKLVTEEHLMISDDLKHDKFAVREFEK